MKHVALLAAASLAAVSTAAIAKPKSVSLKEVKEPVSFSQTERDYDGTFSSRPAVQRVRVPGGLFVSRPQNDMAPDQLMSKNIEIDIRSDIPTLADLQTLLDVQGVSITIDWRSLEDGSADSARVGSFTAASRYQGIANSVNGGSGVQQNGLGGGLGGINGGFGGLNGGIGVGGVNGGVGVGGVNGGIGVGGVNGGVGVGGVNGGINNGLNNGLNGGLNGGFGGGFGGQNQIIPGAAQEEVVDQVGGRPNRNSVNGGGDDEDGRTVSSFYDRALPFRYFKGSVGELIRRLENSGNIAVWYDGGLVIGDVRRYSVAVMQNRDVVQSVVNELLRLGAKDVVGSVGAGQIFYSAPPRTNGEIIEPYLRRLQGNLSEVTLQVALVTVSMSKNAEAGFDWSALNFGYGSNVTTDENAGNTNGTGTGTGGVTVGTNTGLGSGVFTLNNNAFNANLGDIFGTGKILSVAGAIKFLSRIGNTSVAQNVEMRTLSGSPVILRSGENIPFVQNVGATLAGGIGGGALGSSQTAAIGTGLTLNVDPRYDSTSGIVTMDVGLRLVDLVEFVQLNAGAQLGTLTQPRTREQGINSILRLEAGQTAILGGIRRDLSADNRTGPFGAFGIGSRNRQREVFWLFAIVRPVVTVYEMADAPVAARSVLDTRTMVNPRSDGSYGSAGRPGDVNSAYNNQSGVVVSAPPSPRDVVVPSAATPAEVNTGLPSGAVLREPSTSVQPEARPAYQPAPVVRNPEPVIVQRPAPANPSAIQSIDIPQSNTSNTAPVQERKSFIRPMTDSEKGGN